MNFITFFAIFSFLSCSAFAAESAEVWSDAVFKTATQKHKRVILDLEAGWCHWCHVMDEKTYADPAVKKLIAQKFVLVKVDQDSRPDLANRYEDYGWPATIFYDEKGIELAKRSGFIAPVDMIALLNKVSVAKKPLDETEANQTKVNSPDQVLKRIDAMIQLQYDQKNGGWNENHKYLDHYFIELALKTQPKQARQTLDGAQSLVDHVWGGANQYSVDGVWTEPHYEKIIEVQSDFIESFALAYAEQKNDSDLKTARDVVRYVDTFLTSPEGAFYTSQDADVIAGKESKEYYQGSDSDRRAKGIPRIDKNIYARENGWMIHALTLFYEVTGDDALLVRAQKAADWIVKNRALSSAPTGGFRHGESQGKELFLGDTLAMARAFLQLYTATGNREWLTKAETATQFIDTQFKNHHGKAYVTAITDSTILKPVTNADENLILSRLAHLLYEYTGKKAEEKIASQALELVRTPFVFEKIYLASGAKLAIQESKMAPIHITIVGKKSDPKAKELYEAALQYPSAYRRIEWWDKAEGPLPRMDVQYPELSQAAAFACADKRCSLPALKPEQIRSRVDRMIKN